jgi:EAL domain-containing protein (putative c-di-GMP-specific phosphodiesterase class I)
MYPMHGGDVDSLVKSADVAMYRAKARGGDSHCPFTATMSIGAIEQLDLEDALRRSVGNGELELHFQPRFKIPEQEISGFEALIRWTHPVLGPISPARFIPLAEEAGIILDLGDWVLDEACRQIKEWQSGPVANIPVAINLSSVQFNRGDVFQKVTERLSRFAVRPDLLELELTESILMRDADETAAVLRQFKRAGLSVAVDDFGTGYSSLSYLKKFPIDALKIDQSFVSGLGKSDDDRSICMAVIALAHALGLNVVAEGVENDVQLRILQELGCDEIQGFLMSRPMPSSHVLEFVSDHRSCSPAAAVSELQQAAL